MQYQFKVYAVNIELIKDMIFVDDMDNEQFMKEAVRQNTVYSLKQFQNAFNECEIKPSETYIRIL